jgi:hypothetical protein
MTGPPSAAASADPLVVPQDSRGTVLGHRVSSVAPDWIQESNGKRTRHLVGADIRIEAEPGMTPEYLAVELRRDSTSESVFGVQGSTVEVHSTGDGFVFHVTATDTKRAEEIVRRAQRLGK